ncbi:glucan 1,4-alpha-glucosidase [Gorgonomyces haynaldii]|nr:glucan 1,4-alpha-glucosidase [Gorgonomyces haynaldii]
MKVQTSLQVVYAQIQNGSVCASVSTFEPDYYYNWIRDAALTMDYLQTVHQHTSVSLLWDYAHVSLIHQQYDLGEPKFYMNRQLFDKPWGRPQNDGPALRSHVLSRFALSLHDHQNTDVIYRPEMPPNSIVKRDLEYIASNWQNDSFDLWEEVYGMHFYTLCVQIQAMKTGTKIASHKRDPKAAKFYELKAREMSDKLNDFLVDGFYRPILNHPRLTDLSIILAVLHTKTTRMPFKIHSDKIIISIGHLIESMQAYPINSDHLLIGRYPGDVYDGVGQTGGNPWVLGTFALAEYLILLSKSLSERSFVFIGQNMIFYKMCVKDKGFCYNQCLVDLIHCLQTKSLELVKQVSSLVPNGQFPEQLNRSSGKPQGAPNLTWSHVSFLQFENVRNQISISV